MVEAILWMNQANARRGEIGEDGREMALELGQNEPET